MYSCFLNGLLEQELLDADDDLWPQLEQMYPMMTSSIKINEKRLHQRVAPGCGAMNKASKPMQKDCLNLRNSQCQDVTLAAAL